MTNRTTTRFDAELRAAGLTQVGVAQRRSIQRGDVNRIARGRQRPTQEQAIALCDELGWPHERAEELFEVLPREAVRVVIVREPAGTDAQ